MTQSKQAFIVRKQSDVAEASRSGEKFFFLCINRPVFEFCEKSGEGCLLLEEDLLRGQYEAINLWGYEKTIHFVARFSTNKTKNVFFESNFIHTQRLFVQALKICLVLKKIIDDRKLDEIRIFDDGSSVLASACVEYLRRFHPEIAFHALPDKHPLKPKKNISLKRIVASFLPPLVNYAANRRMKCEAKKNRKLLLVSGAVHHLFPVLRLLQDRYHVVYAENDFNLEKYNFCKAHGMTFLILPKPDGCAALLDLSPFEFDAGEILYDGTDYSDFFGALLDKFFLHGAPQSAYDQKKLSDLYESRDFDAVLLDEDIAMRRMIGVAFGQDYFVISHGIPAGFSENAKLRGKYKSGTTFAGSEFERFEYEKLFYAPEKVKVTGIPRYDRIHAIKQTERNASGLKNILHCGASMSPFGFENSYVLLGLKNFLGEYSEIYLRALLDLMEGHEDAVLKIKPHYNEEHLWEKCIKARSGKKINYELLSHKDDTVRLEWEADLIVTVESSVVIEAILLEKPVIVLNFTPEPLISNYEKHGLIEHVRTKDELRDAMRKCLYDTGYLKELAERRKHHFDYFAGPFDGQNARRVAEVIAHV